jgi:hypothetical protein
MFVAMTLMPYFVILIKNMSYISDTKIYMLLEICYVQPHVIIRTKEKL